MMVVEVNAIRKAIEVAVEAHANQRRRDGVTPYITHPAHVATLVAMYGGSHRAIISAWLHDVMEDTEGNSGYLIIDGYLQTCGLHYKTAALIDEMISALTKDKTIMNREERNEENLRRLLCAPPETILVKLCDRISNLSDMGNVEDTFGERYLEDSQVLYSGLYTRARELGYIVPLNVFDQLIKF